MKLNRLNPLFVAVLLTASLGTVRASVMYELTIDLSNLNPGSDFMGVATVPAQLGIGGSTPITLTGSPSADYSPSTITTTLSVAAGPSGFNSLLFSELTFTNNISGNPVDIIVNAPAHCAVSSTISDCHTDGLWIGNNQFGGSGVYALTIQTSGTTPSGGSPGPGTSTPEPGSAAVVLGLAAIVAFKRQLRRL